ncbi:AdipoR/hemolysin-III-related protein [Dioscorea alata]|uniref:AdipoR/hemolysin-III-related protein n=1 Tax=Dioscorea alata TaxID=55571 RepID=A0ACB7VF05_DIOAL|nr:AdipoR/hemolysin-III-related protein [Dioscorea alata]
MGKTCTFQCKETAKCELVGFESLPTFLKDNEFILNYYRSQWPWKQTILSIFSIHNETLNIWTHLIGFIIFLTLTLCAMHAFAPLTFSQSSDKVIIMSLNATSATVFRAQVPANQTNIINVLSIMKDDDVLESTTTRWPFYAYLFGAMFCLLTSSVCHLLSCHSEHCAYTMLRLDYAGISTLIVTSFYPLVYYTFMCDPFVRNIYIGFITVFGVAAILASLVPAFQTPEFRSVRALLFFCMGVSGLVPIIHKLMVFSEEPVAVMTAIYELVMGGFYGLGVVVYATRMPERWMPGKFDLVGHSHQLFHVLVIAGAYTHYLASVMYLNWREMDQCYLL